MNPLGPQMYLDKCLTSQHHKSVIERLFLQLMSEFVLSARLCLLIDWILFRDPGMTT